MSENTKTIDDKVKEISSKTDGIYVLDIDNYKRLCIVYSELRKFSLQNDGGIADIQMEPTTEFAKISVVVPTVDLYRDGLEQFINLLSMIDALDVSTTEDGFLMIGAAVSGVWKAVRENEQE